MLGMTCFLRRFPNPILGAMPAMAEDKNEDGETLRSIGRSYNVSAATIGRLA